MRSLRASIAKNAAANVVRGGALAVVAVVLPHFLTRLLGPDRFAGWALMLQVAAYANYLDFGLQTAVARYFAGALEENDQELCNRVLGNAIAILTLAGAIAFCGLTIVAWQFPHLFRGVSPGLAREIGSGLIILGLSAAVGLPLSAYTGVLVGMQRNEFPAIAAAVSRIVGTVAVIFVARRTQSLVVLSICIGGLNPISAVAQYAIARKLLPFLRFSRTYFDRTIAAELIRYCSTLSIWSFGMLLVSGLDVTIVGLFRFQAVGAYSIAATLITLFTGLNGAAFSAMLAPVAALQARKEYPRIAHLILSTTRLSSYFNMAVIASVFLFGRPLVRAWVGPAYESITLPVLEILVVAQATRLVGGAYGSVLVAMGLQRYGLVPVVVEGILNLLLSVLGVMLIGPTGVAWATVIAAMAAVTITISFVMPRVRQIDLNIRRFIWYGILAPSLTFLPIWIWILCRSAYEKAVHPAGLFTNLPVILVVVLTAVFVSRGARRARLLNA